MATLPSKKVSVVVPNYNYARYIGKRIDSIVRQTYPIYELIILDDASTDESVEVIEKKLVEIRAKYPELKVQFVRNDKNSGKAIAAWKKGWGLATGDYIWIAEADDLCNRRFLDEVMKGFDDPEVVLSYAESMLINGVGLVMAPNFRWSRDKEKTGHYKKSYVKDGRQEIEEIMAIRCTIPNVSAVVMRKKEIFLNYLEEALQFGQVGDWYFYMKVLENGKISYNRKALNKFRVHSDSKTGQAKKDRRHHQEILDMHKMFAIRYNLTKSVVKSMKMEELRVGQRMERSNHK